MPSSSQITEGVAGQALEERLPAGRDEGRGGLWSRRSRASTTRARCCRSTWSCLRAAPLCMSAVGICVVVGRVDACASVTWTSLIATLCLARQRGQKSGASQCARGVNPNRHRGHLYSVIATATYPSLGDR